MASGSGPSDGVRQLPSRTTRGKRMAAAMDDEEAQADEQFWNQEFFQEEAQDVDYERSASEEDVPDSDFDEPEDEEDDEDVEEVDEKPKRKALKAPEPKAPPRARAAPKKPAKRMDDDDEEEEYDMDEDDEDLVERDSDEEDDEERPRSSKPQISAEERARIRRDEKKARELAAQANYAAPSLRRTTQQKSAEAKQEREWRNEMSQYRRPAKRSKSSKTHTLSQAELLAEAARTEIENIQSLKHLLAMEEATKKKAMIVKQKYMGPTVRVISKKRMLLPGSPAALQAAAVRKAALEARAALDAAAAPQPAATQQEPAATTAAAGAQSEQKQQQDEGQQGGQEPGRWTAEDKPQPEGVDVEMPDASASQQLPASSQGVREGGSQAAGGADAKEGEAGQQDAGKEGGGAAGDKGEGQQDEKAGTSANQDDNEYEATLYYEIAYMQYPPMWLRRFRALPPPAKAMCGATGQPAKYKDPGSGTPYASAAAYRQIKGLPQAPAQQQQQTQQHQSIPLSVTGLQELRAQQAAAAGTEDAVIGRGGTCLLANPPSSSTLSARAKAAYASLPPPPPDLPPPSAVLPPLPPQGIPLDMMCLLVDLQRGMAGSSTGGVSTRSTYIPSY